MLGPEKKISLWIPETKIKNKPTMNVTLSATSSGMAKHVTVLGLNGQNLAAVGLKPSSIPTLAAS